METPKVTNVIARAESPKQSHELQIANEKFGVNETDKKTSTHEKVKEVRDWITEGLVAVSSMVVIIWGGQAIIDRYSKPTDENIKGLIEIIDSDGDGKLSKKEKDDLKGLIKELQEWKKVKDQIGNIFGGK